MEESQEGSEAAGAVDEQPFMHPSQYMAERMLAVAIDNLEHENEITDTDVQRIMTAIALTATQIILNACGGDEGLAEQNIDTLRTQIQAMVFGKLRRTSPHARSN